MRAKTLSIALALTVVLSASTLTAAPKRSDARGPEITPIEWVVRAIKKIVRTFDQPVVPIPAATTT